MNKNKIITIVLTAIFSTIFFAMGVFSLPDLSVDYVGVFDFNKFSQNQTVDFVVYIANNGDFDAYNKILIKYGDGATQTINDTIFANEKLKIPLSHNYASYGTYNFSVEMDSDKIVDETSEANNVYSKTVSLTQESYAFDVTVADMKLYIGTDVTDVPKTISLPITLQNKGNQDLTITLLPHSINSTNSKSITSEFSQTTLVPYLQTGVNTVSLNYVLKDMSISKEGNYSVQMIFSNQKGQTVTKDVKISVTRPQVSLTITESPVDFPQKQRGSTIDGSFTVKNNGPLSLTDVTIEPSVTSGYSFSTKKFNLAVGEERTITFSKNISSTESSGNHNEPIYVRNALLDKSYVYVNKYSIDSMLGIGTIKYTIDESAKKTLSSKLDAKPNSLISLEVELKNLYTKSVPKNDRISMDNVEITVESGDLDLIEDTISADSSIDAGEDITVTVNFDKLPIDVEANNYEITMIVSGEDSEGIAHEVRKTFTINVKKDRHAVTLDKIDMLNDKVETFELPTQIEVMVDNLCNIGTSNEDLTLTFESNKLDIHDIEQVTLKKDSDCFRESYTFDVDDVQPGSYPIEVTVEGKNIDTITKSYTFQVLGTADDEFDKITTLPSKSGTLTPVNPVNSATVGNNTEGAITEDKSILPKVNMENLIVGLLISGIVIMIGFIGFVGYKIANKDSY
jgi:hypothetical protein